ncbi:hypothetical protein EDM53_05415 [Rickettsiales endosymbiont of Peranema trichophorum]|uniref:imm11 family protein n=1 Tax=Rickettsiales endosymbiont of Peranema trichophorum TaxID=2486577 RepID=UPI001023F2FD|nr:DUF1629 domain-containing protein [Rickettsiales endosymbiont of Peranema trichophorum]RZI45322.1 hypothetical protein EDM53_05415 [Rickettsiales endosymbiont of Peranema trichophorum]
MAYFLKSGYRIPNYLVPHPNWKKIGEVATESLEEYLVTNRFGMGADRISIIDPIWRSLHDGYKANVKCLHFEYEEDDGRGRPAAKERLLKYDALETAGVDVPLVKEKVLEVFKEYCGGKIQVIDVVLTLEDGEEIRDYKGINVINRVEAFTWEGSKKKSSYEEYGHGPNAFSMDVIAFREDVVEKEVICKDCVTNSSDILISESLGTALKKGRFKGLGLIPKDYAGSILV